MDIYDPQTLGIVVFGGFMVISAIGIALVSTFSMKETSYEEALAKQRLEHGKMQPSSADKKKKVCEKKNRAKKKDDKPNRKIPEQTSEVPVVDPLSEPTYASPASALTPECSSGPKPAPPMAPVDIQPKAAVFPSGTLESSSAPSSKDKKKKKMAKDESASALSVPAAPASAPAAAAKVALALAKSGPGQAPSQAKSGPGQAPSQAKSGPGQAPSQAKSGPGQAPSQAKSGPASSKMPQSTAKSTLALSKLSKSAPVLEAVTKEVPVMAVPPVGSQQTASVATIKAQEPKQKASKKKSEPAVDSVDAPLYLSYKTLVSAISSMAFSEGEAQRLIELLSEKAGVIQDTWHMATQKGDPVATLKKQLDEKERQLASEQEDAAAAKTRLREVSKELSAEKSKVASVETRLSSQLSKREQEMNALQTRMQASYQDHVTQTQRLNAKIVSLQEQLEKGPSAQLACLQQENSILRDALNQATSLAESKHNTEFAKLHQDCSKLTKELAEKMDSVQAEETIRRGLESKVATAEKQLAVLQASHVEHEQALQRRLEEVCEDLRTVQRTNSSLQASAEKAQQESNALSELQARVGSLEAELSERSGHVDSLTGQLDRARAEKSQLEQQVATINSLLEANQSQKDNDDNEANSTELEQIKLSLQERDSQLTSLQDQLKQLQTEMTSKTNVEPEQNTKSEDASLAASLQDELTNLKDEMERLKKKAADDSAEQALLQRSLNARDAQLTSIQDELHAERDRSQDNQNAMAQLSSFQTEPKETLQTLFPQISIVAEQSNWLQDFTQKAQELLGQSQETQSSTELPELLEKLKDAEESRVSLQAECEQYRSVLSETEGTLKVLQKSVEEEELVWKSKMVDSEEQLRVLREHVMLLEAQLEKQAESVTPEHQWVAEMAQLKQLLAECQSKLDSARQEAQAHKEALVQVTEQLIQVTKHTRLEQNGPAVAAPSQVHSELSLTTGKLHVEETLRQQLSEEIEQTQRTMSELQTQMTLLKAAEDCTQADTDDVIQLKECLEKEKQLSKDLGQAATKLQQLLKATQEQLTKERDTVRTLQEHLEGKGEYVELKEGTSV